MLTTPTTTPTLAPLAAPTWWPSGRVKVPPPRPPTAPLIQVLLPDGQQLTLPGEEWSNPTIWDAAGRALDSRPPIEIRQITRKTSNALIEQWGTHPLGIERRLYGYTAFALYVLGEPIALASAATTHSASVDKQHGLRRGNVIELSRLCRSDNPHARGSLRIILRAWRDFLSTAYWRYYPQEEVIALVSYSMPGKTGHTYRTDGWQRLRNCRPWGGASNWSAPSRTGSTPAALWVYWLAEHQRRPPLTSPPQPAGTPAA
jgi:hypothetical protein